MRAQLAVVTLLLSCLACGGLPSGQRPPSSEQELRSRIAELPIPAELPDLYEVAAPPQAAPGGPTTLTRTDIPMQGEFGPAEYRKGYVWVGRMDPADPTSETVVLRVGLEFGPEACGPARRWVRGMLGPKKGGTETWVGWADVTWQHWTLGYLTPQVCQISWSHQPVGADAASSARYMRTLLAVRRARDRGDVNEAARLIANAGLPEERQAQLRNDASQVSSETGSAQ